MKPTYLAAILFGIASAAKITTFTTLTTTSLTAPTIPTTPTTPTALPPAPSAGSTYEEAYAYCDAKYPAPGPDSIRAGLTACMIEMITDFDIEFGPLKREELEVAEATSTTTATPAARSSVPTESSLLPEALEECDGKYPGDSSDSNAQAARLMCLVSKFKTTDVRGPKVKRERINAHMAPSSLVHEALDTCEAMYPDYTTDRIAGIAWVLCVIQKGKSIDMRIPNATPGEMEKVMKLMESVEADFEQ